MSPALISSISMCACGAPLASLLEAVLVCELRVLREHVRRPRFATCCAVHFNPEQCKSWEPRAERNSLRVCVTTAHHRNGALSVVAQCQRCR